MWRERPINGSWSRPGYQRRSLNGSCDALVSAVAAYRSDYWTDLQARVGIVTGGAATTETAEEGLVISNRVNTAARIQSAAPPVRPVRSGGVVLGEGSEGGQWAGSSPPVWAKVLLTIFQIPSIRTSEKKSRNDTCPQAPSSTTTADAAAPSWVTETTLA